MLDERGVGVDRVAAAGADLEVQVRAGGVAGGADGTDHLAGGHESPTLTDCDDWWQYQISVPSSSVITVLLPYAPS